MTVESALDLAHQCMALAFEISFPVLAISMSIGIAVAIFQAATQIQEASLAFVPKLVGMGIALLVFGGWIIDKLLTFTISMLNTMATVNG
jgi:flagellar biosynthetic protein FliQ